MAVIHFVGVVLLITVQENSAKERTS
jgi:hypothetical protein